MLFNTNRHDCLCCFFPCSTFFRIGPLLSMITIKKTSIKAKQKINNSLFIVCLEIIQFQNATPVNMNDYL